MDIRGIVKGLHPLEVRVLRRYRRGSPITAESIMKDLEYKLGQCNQVFSWLQAKGLVVEKTRRTKTAYELTELGKEYVEKGSPEERIMKLLGDKGPLSIRDITDRLGLENKDVGSAFGILSKEGALGMDGEKRVTILDAAKAARLSVTRRIFELAASSGIVDEDALSEMEKGVVAGIAKKRGAGTAPFRVVERDEVVYELEAGVDDIRAELETEGITGEEAGAVTPEMLETGSWKTSSFRAYNIDLPPGRLIPGRRNAYAEFLENTKDKLVSLGFEEFDGSLVETEFWNCDALFMPQFHAARDIHDVYSVKSPEKAKFIEEPYLSAVARVHEDGGDTGSRGWQYGFDREFTKRLILRSQGTVMSARTLPKARVPGRYFGMLRCFRYDKVDATHLSDFYQTEGIVLGEEVNLRTLLGFLEMFAVEVAGATEVKYVPGYFPFTEPSVEVHIKHPVLGWFELGGSGIFRPEVSKTLGVDCPVLAWGIGIDRMALMALGLNDLRELFSNDIESVRMRRAKGN
jgi:phenylalanyl-tRNA synthetase alpha chain